MSQTGIYILIAVAIGCVIYVLLGKFASNPEPFEEKFDADMNTALDLSRECLDEAKETNRILTEINELLEKK